MPGSERRKEKGGRGVAASRRPTDASTDAAGGRERDLAGWLAGWLARPGSGTEEEGEEEEEEAFEGDVVLK